MADFGIINLQPEGDITSYDPPEALVYEFGTFHDEIHDRIVSVMSLLPNSTARPSIDKLRRTKEKPGAKRSVLKANKAFSKIEIPKDTPVIAELDDNDAMHIPFFQYANPDKYYVLENQGKSMKDILQQSVDLSKLKNRSDASPLTSYHHQDFDLKSDHPSVTFIDKQRASFAGFFTGPILDGHHNVALHGFLQEPVNIAVRSGFNTRVVKLPIGFEMVVPLKFGVIHFDEEGKPERWTTTPEGLKRLPPPPPGNGGLPEFPEVPTHPVGQPRDFMDPNILNNIPSRSVGQPRDFMDPNILQRPSGTIPGPIDPSILNVPRREQPVEPPSLGDIELNGYDELFEEAEPVPEEERVPGSSEEERVPGSSEEEGVPGLSEAEQIPEGEGAREPSSVQRALAERMRRQARERASRVRRQPAAAEVTTQPVEGVEGQTITGPTGPATLQRAVTTRREGVPTAEEGEGEAVPVPARREAAPTAEEGEGEAIPVPTRREPVQTPVEDGETVPVPTRREREAAPAATVRTSTVTPNFREDVIRELANFIRSSGVQIEDIEGELERYQPLVSYLNRIAITNTNRPYTVEMPSLTRQGVYDTFVDEPRNTEDVVRIALNDPNVVFDFRIEVDSTPSNVVERIDGRVNVVAVSRPVAFRMKPNPSLLKYVLFLRRGRPVVVARPARFRMEPNESLREFVKIEV